MSLNAQISKHLKDVYFGGNWTSVNFKDTLADITWQQATTKVYQLNTIATLVYHCGYYLSALYRVLHGEPLNAKDEYSFNLPSVQSQRDWENLLEKTFADAAHCARLIKELPERKLNDDFTDRKFGSYYRNMAGIIEHSHYHLGQIVIIKKIILSERK